MTKCKVCNGTHVYTGHGKGFTAFMTCYECGPVTMQQFDEDMAAFRARITAAKKEMEVAV